MVMTCSLLMADTDEADDEVILSWLDDSGQEVSSVTGRYEETINLSTLIAILIAIFPVNRSHDFFFVYYFFTHTHAHMHARMCARGEMNCGVSLSRH